jgi:cytochrome c-type biogenesis protein CcmH
MASSFAVQPGEALSDPVLEKRARELSMELRCLVCQNESIEDSHAPLAKDVRLLVREKLQNGATNSEIMSFLVQRYGEFILLKPPFAAHTWLLWLTPLLFLGGGGLALIAMARKNRSAIRETLSKSERKAIDAFLAEHTSQDSTK